MSRSIDVDSANAADAAQRAIHLPDAPAAGETRDGEIDLDDAVRVHVATSSMQ